MQSLFSLEKTPKLVFAMGLLVCYNKVRFDAKRGIYGKEGY